jgi:hypothetical protein
MMTTGSFSSKHLLKEEVLLKIPKFSNQEAIELGEIATDLGMHKSLPIAV